jgi:hypothetical protein
MLTQSNLHDPGQLVLYGYASLVVVRGEMKLILALSNPATQADVLRDLLSGTEMTVVALSGKIGLETDTLVEAALDLTDYNCDYNCAPHLFDPRAVTVRRRFIA